MYPHKSRVIFGSFHARSTSASPQGQIVGEMMGSAGCRGVGLHGLDYAATIPTCPEAWQLHGYGLSPQMAVTPFFRSSLAYSTTFVTLSMTILKVLLPVFFHS